MFGGITSVFTVFDNPYLGSGLNTINRKFMNTTIEQIKKYENLIRDTLNDKKRIWDLSNEVLYNMCKEHPYHKNPQEIIMKTLIIGRVYSVQLERRKNKGKLIGDKFYEDRVIPTFKNSGLDERLLNLRSKDLSQEVFHEIFEVHNFLMKRLQLITKMDKRSFCSKYLHFHFPDLFFLYDSRLRQSVSILKGKIEKEQKEKFLVKTSKYDKEYVEFFLKCYNLKTELQTFLHLHRNLTIREFDTIMIEISNDINQKKLKRKSV